MVKNVPDLARSYVQRSVTDARDEMPPQWAHTS